MNDQEPVNNDPSMQVIVVGQTATFDLDLTVGEIKLLIRGLRRERKSLRQQLQGAVVPAHRKVSRPSRLQREEAATSVLLGKLSQFRAWCFVDRAAAEVAA